MTFASNTILLTGLPRSGTTLVCALLNECPDTVALAEPLSLAANGDRTRAMSEIKQFIATTRNQLLETNAAMSCHIDGVVPDNWLDEPLGSNGRLRRSRAQLGCIRFNKPISTAFSLVIKHPAEFSALADLLVGQIPLYAMVRHPLAVLASWQTADLPVHHGHMPAAEAFNPELAACLAAEPDRLARQVRLIGWLLSTYARLLPDNVLRYEDLISDPRACLSRIIADVCIPPRTLSAQKLTVRYAGIDLTELATALKEIGPVAQVFYPDFDQSLTGWID
jgi:Sulfotransferase family